MPAPLTPTQIKEGDVQLTLNENVKLPFPSWDQLVTLDGEVVRIRDSCSSPSSHILPWMIKMYHHPTVASSFATSPPVTVCFRPFPSLFPGRFALSPSLFRSRLLVFPSQELLLWFGHTPVSNPDGVTVWDVRMAFVNSPMFVASSSLLLPSLSLPLSRWLVRDPDLARLFLRLSSLTPNTYNITHRGADLWVSRGGNL